MEHRFARRATLITLCLMIFGCGSTDAPPIEKDTVDIGDRPKPGAKEPQPIPVQKPSVKIPNIKLVDSALDFAFDPQNGSLIALEPASGTIREYSRKYLDGLDKTTPPPILVGSRPSALTFKSLKDRRFVAVTLENGDVAIVDLSAAPPTVKVVPIERKNPGEIVASEDVEDVYFYYSGAKPTSPPANRPPNVPELLAFGRINPATAKREDLTLAPDLQLMAMSADGRVVYGRANGTAISAYSVADLSSPIGDRVVTLLGSTSFSAARVLPDSMGQSVAVSDRAGGMIFDANLTKKIGDLPVFPLAYFHDRAMVVGARDSNIRFFATKDGKELGKVPFAETTFDSQQLPVNVPGVSGTRPRGFADDFGERLVLANGQQAFLIPIPKGLPKEPVLALTVRGELVHPIGKPMTLELKPRTPGTVMTLASGPSGMSLSGDVLKWTPSELQVGHTKATITLALDGRTREETIGMEAIHPNVRLTFNADLLALDGAGRFAVVGESPLRSDTRNSLALIDLEKMTLTAETELPDRFLALALDDDRVYVAHAMTAVIFAFDRNQFKPTARVFAPFVAQTLIPVAGGRLVAMPEIHTQAIYAQPPGDSGVFTRPDLRPTSALFPKLGNPDGAMSRASGPALQAISDGLFVQEGVVVELGAVASKAKMLLQPAGFFHADTPSPTPFDVSPMIATPWGRMAQGTLGVSAGRNRRLIANSPGSRPAVQNSQVQAGPMLLSKSDPVSIQLESERFHNGVPRSIKRLLVRDLVLGRTIAVIPIYDRILGPANTAFFHDSMGVMQISGRRLVLLDDFGLTVVSLDALDLKSIPRPLHFGLIQSELSVGPTGTTNVSYVLRGGAPPYHLELIDQNPAFRLDPDTVMLAIDGEKLVDMALESLARSFNDRLRSMSKPEFEKIVQEQAKRFEILVGVAPRGVPVLVPINLKATDAEAQTAFLDHMIFVEVPQSKVEEMRTKPLPKR